MPRVDALTGLRWYAAFFVFTYHMLVFAPLPGPLTALLGQGFFGVTFFFILSGFVLTWSASSRVSRSTFYWRRFARVWPASIVALIFAIPVFYSFDPDPAQTWVKPVSLGVLALSVVLVQGWSLNPVILFSGNPAAWTLTCEAFFYAAHPYLSKILYPLKVRGTLVFVGVVALIMFAYRLFAVTSPESLLAALPLPIVRITEFAIGMGIAWAFRRGWHPRLPVAAGIASLALVIAAIVLIPHYRVDSAAAWIVSNFANELVALACTATIVAFAAASLSGRRSFLASSMHVRLGEWSYAFYLVHATFIYIALAAFGLQPANWVNLLWFAGLLAAGLAGGAALHHCVEKPVEKRMRAWKDARDLQSVS
jgi:peptidoglycan/LPS O-acetylase OafA/YrhL